MVANPVTGLPTTDVTIVLKERSGEWAGHWGEGAEELSRKELLSSFGSLDPIPPLEPQHLIAASLSFKLQTSSRDGFHPRHFALLPHCALVILCRLFNCFENCGVIPAQMGGALVALIPKPQGGDRPIGLLQGATRLYYKARRPITR